MEEVAYIALLAGAGERRRRWRPFGHGHGALLAARAGLGGCGDDDASGAASAAARGRRRREGRADARRGARRHGRRDVLRRARTRPAATQRTVERFNERYADQGLRGRAARVPRGLRQPARAGRPAARGALARVRRRSRPTSSGSPSSRRRSWAMDLTELRRGSRGRVHPLDARPEPVRRPLLGACRRSPARGCSTAAPTRSPSRRRLAGALPRGGRPRRHVLPGRRVRGPDLQLPRDRLRRRAAACCPRTGSRRRSTRPRTSRALKFMVDGIEYGAAPQGVITYMEEPARRAFEAGRVSFMRNWSYAYALNQKAPEVHGPLRGHAAAAVRGRRARRHPRRQRAVPLRLLGEPGGRAAVHRPPDVGGDARS